jgi:hypothetical protein
MCRRTSRSRLTGVSRALGWVCMGCEVSGSEVTPGPWRPHTSLSAEQPGGTTHLGAAKTKTQLQELPGLGGVSIGVRVE